jgi:hypothetical protein
MPLRAGATPGKLPQLKLNRPGDCSTRERKREEEMKPPMLAVCRVALMIMALDACAGRAPQPVAVVQPQDRFADCAAIFAEVQTNNQKIQYLAGDEGSKVAQNVAAGVVGLFVWPVWFAMDFQGAAGKDVAALQSRQQYLAILAEQRNCAAGPVAPATISTPATLPPATVTAPAATPISTAATPGPTAGAWPNIIPALSPPAPAATAAPAMPGATFDTNSYEEGQQQYRQAEQQYQRQLELQRAQGR